MEILKLGDWHVIFLHFPIALYYTGLIFDLLGGIFKINVYPAGHWIVIFAVITTIPTVITGLDLTDEFSRNRYFELHRNWGLMTLGFGLLHGTYRAYVLKAKKAFRYWVFMTLSVVSCFLVTITADWGGLIVFGKGFLKQRTIHSP